MMKKQNGIAHIGMLLSAVVVMGVIGTIGWKVLHGSVANGSPPIATSGATTNKKVESTAKTTKSEGYALVIKEWGVEIPLSSKDSGAYYTVDTDTKQNISDPTNLTVYAKEIDALVGPTGKSCEGEYIAYLLRLPSSDARWQPAQTVDDGNVSPLFGKRIVIGDYRYAIATKKSYGPECFENNTTGDYVADATTSQQFADVVSAFVEDFQGIH
jgi:hypothetical protein